LDDLSIYTSNFSQKDPLRFAVESSEFVPELFEYSSVYRPPPDLTSHLPT